MHKRRSLLSVSALVLAFGGGHAAADVDATGRWVLRAEISGSFELVETWSQSGTVLTTSSGFSGTIDPATGVFSMSQPSATMGLCPGNSRVGSISADGGSLTGMDVLHDLTLTSCFVSFEIPFTGTRCGCGLIEGGEECDDGNRIDGDGCSASCEIEACFTCAGEPSNCERLAPGTVGPECDPQCEIHYGAGGTVTDFETGQPIAGANVTVWTEDGASSVGTTGADGTYQVGGSTTVRCFIDYFVDVRIRANGYYEARRTGYFSTAFMPASVALQPWLAGDCNLDKWVDVSELVVGLQVLLGREPLERCAALDVDRDGSGDLLDLVHAIQNAREGSAANQ